MKARKFMSGWKHYDPIPDPLMTNERAVRLMRAWRRARLQGNRVFKLERLAPHQYRVTHVDSGEEATMIWMAA